MELFPIGTVAAGSDNGTINGVSYSIFEPNNGAYSHIIYYNLFTRFENQTLLTRQKALPSLSLKYEYSNIFSSEFNQLEHFVFSKTGGLTSFYAIDFSQIIVPTSVDSSYDITLSNTRLFSATTNYKANWIFLWNGNTWKLVAISSITANTSITTNATANYGAMTGTQASAGDVVIYPVYQVYFSENPLSSFSKSTFFDDDEGSNYGYMYSGNISMTSKYKV